MFVCAMGTIGALISTAELDELPFKLYLEVLRHQINRDEMFREQLLRIR